MNYYNLSDELLIFNLHMTGKSVETTAAPFNLTELFANINEGVQGFVKNLNAPVTVAPAKN